MRASKIVLVVLGCLVAVPAVALLLSGAILGVASAAQGRDGFFDVTLDRIDSSTVAVTAEDIDLRADPGTPSWILDATDTDIRLQVSSTDPDQAIFVGIGPETDVDQYLAGVAHDEVRDIDDRRVEFRSRDGGLDITPPETQDFWTEQAAGTGTQELVWEATSGRWAVVVMNADASPDVSADVTVGARSAAVIPLTIALLGLGLVLGLVATLLIVLGVRGDRPAEDAIDLDRLTAPDRPAGTYPLRLEARLDPQLSPWRWLIKWLLAIPHLIVLVVLWAAFVILTIAAGFAILFTGRYPRNLFDVNVGILRWGWRVSYYAFSGGLGTDRYPRFSLDHDPAYPATLQVDYPGQLSRWKVLVKWWLLAIPHYVVVAVLVGGGTWSGFDEGSGTVGLTSILTLIAAVILLFTARYPQPLFDLIVGLNRWLYRVIAYAALMTDQYPPFRLDQGGAEPVPPPDHPPDDHDRSVTTAGTAEPPSAPEPVATTT